MPPHTVRSLRGFSLTIHTFSWLALDVKTLLSAGASSGNTSCSLAGHCNTQPLSHPTSSRACIRTFLMLEADLTEPRALSWLATLVKEQLTAQQMDEILIWVSHDLYK